MSDLLAVWAAALLVAVFVLRWRLPTVATVFGSFGVAVLALLAWWWSGF